MEPDRWQDITNERRCWNSIAEGVELQENVQLYLIKWRNLSHLHCSWESEKSLIELEKTRMKQKLGVLCRLIKIITHRNFYEMKKI